MGRIPPQVCLTPQSLKDCTSLRHCSQNRDTLQTQTHFVLICATGSVRLPLTDKKTKYQGIESNSQEESWVGDGISKYTSTSIHSKI